MSQMQAQAQQPEQNPLTAEAAEEEKPREIGVVYQKKDGSYEWTYCMDLKKDPLMFEIVFLTLGISFALILGVMLGAGGFDAEILGIILLCFAVIVLIGLFSLWLVGKMYGGKYYMVFQMDEEGITMSQISEQAAKTRLISDLSVLTGALTHSPGLISSGIAGRSSTSAHSDFKNVSSVSANRRRNKITLRSLLFFNLIYVADPYYDFVLNYIRSRCKNAAHS